MNQTLPAVSVIIPMYNAEKYIAECLESILEQTLQNFEVIVVDDCSTDNSCSMAESYAEKFSGRLKLVSLPENSGGGGLPRNKGFSFSRGEYVFFMDSDDLLTQTALEEMYTLTKDFNADVVYCEKFYTIDAAFNELKLHSEQEGGFVTKPTLETENLARRVENILSYRYWVTPWLKFVRRDFMTENEIFFPHTRTSQDDIWTYGLVFYAKKFLRVPNIVYIYRLSENSIQRSPRQPQNQFKVWLNPIIFGLKHLDKFMSRLEFFRQNPQYRYAVLENFVHCKIGTIFRPSLEVAPAEAYNVIKNEFGKNLSEWDVLIPFLLADLIEQQKIFVKNQERIAELEQKIK